MAILEFTDAFKDFTSVANVPVLLTDEYKVMDAPTEWLIEKSSIRSRSEDTRTNYGYVICHYFNWLEEKNLSWNLVTLEELGQYVTEQQLSEKPDGDSLEGSTINYRIGRVIDFYRFAEKQGYKHFVKVDQIQKVITVDVNESMLGHVRSNKKVIRSHGLSVSQIERKFKIISRSDFVRACATFNDPVYVYTAMVMYTTALRRMEVVQLEYRTRKNPEFIPLSERSRVRSGDLTSDLTFKFKGKGGKNRDIPFPMEVWSEICHSYLPLRKQRAELYAERHGGEYPSQLLLTSRGKPITRTGVSWAFRTVSKALGKPFRPHMLRHSFATGFTEHYLEAQRLDSTVGYDAGLDLALQEYMGHLSFKTTKKYIHLVHTLRGMDLLKDYRPKIGEDMKTIVSNVLKSA